MSVATLPVYNIAGDQVGEQELPGVFLGESPNLGVLHQVVVAELAARRQGTAHTKKRSEVSGSGRKLWRQKGTGRARVGDRRPPHRIGGGRATGPRMRSYRQRVSAGLKEEALRSALGARAAAGEILLLEPFELTEAKTQALAEVLEAVGGRGSALLVLGQADERIARCGRNLPGLRVAEAAGVSAAQVMAARKVILTTDALPRLEARVA